MSNAQPVPTRAPLAPGIYVDEIDPGTPDMPAVTRELTRASLEQICEDELAGWVYEEHTPRTQAQFTAHLRGHLVMRWARGLLEGQSVQDAFFIRCDHITTQADLDDGILICEVGMAPVNPAEFVIFRVLVRFASRS